MAIRANEISSSATARQNCESCLNGDELQAKRHTKVGHQCQKETCSIKHPHGHRTLIEHLKKILPFEEKIRNLKISNKEQINQTLKQLLLMVTNLTPALAASEVMKPFEVSSFIASPVAISAMHFTNRGINQLSKWLFTSLSSIGIVGLQKFANLPRALIRPLMALAVFFIERNGKSDLIKLVKLQGQINTVPWIVNSLTDKLYQTVGSHDDFLTRTFGKVGTFVFQVIGLSAGFVGMGELLDKLFTKFNIVSHEDALAMRTEGAVCACCGAPVCISEVASEVGSMSIAA